MICFITLIKYFITDLVKAKVRSLDQICLHFVFVLHHYFSGESKLEEGERVYPFNISLPLQLPSTFNGEHGHVRYTAKVTVDIPWGKDKETEITFQVISPLNLNDEPSLAASIIFM